MKNTKHDTKKVTLHIKNMVCDRCIKVVREELTKLGYDICHVKLGEAAIYEQPKPDIAKIKIILADNGFELIEDKKGKIVEQIKKEIIDLVHHSDKLEDLKENISDYIAKQLKQEYHSLSKLFSSVENTTIEKYLIAQKIERVKELLVYGELTLSEISYKLGYSSVQHLSNQFKQFTGFTPSHFKEIKQEKRRSIDRVR
ncbi:MAG: AraC family transcriptional regulator [Bacteroidota bacterium]